MEQAGDWDCVSVPKGLDFSTDMEKQSDQRWVTSSSSR